MNIKKIIISINFLFVCGCSYGQLTNILEIIHYEPILKEGYSKLISEEIGFDRRVRVVVADNGQQYQLSDRIQNSLEVYTDSNRFLESGKSEDQEVLSRSVSNALLIFYPSASLEERTSVLEKYGLRSVEELGYVYEVESINATPIQIEGEPFVVAIWPSAKNQMIQNPMQPLGFPALSPFWRNRNIVDGWRQTRIGLINDNRYPWVYHVDKGWLYFFTGKESPYEYATDTTYYWSQADGWTKLD